MSLLLTSELIRALKGNHYSMNSIDHSTILAPVVLFVYNRLDHVTQTIKYLQENRLANVSDLYIYSDGASSERDQLSVEEVRAYLKTVEGFSSVVIVEQTENFGLAKSIISGVTEIVNRFGKIIVLEDDLITSPYFLDFMNDALLTYESQSRVMHVSGYMYPIRHKSLPSSFFLRPTSCWGWATWKGSWEVFKKNSDYYLEVFDRKMIKQFNLNGSYDYFEQILANKSGAINSWAIYWYASCFLNDGLSLHPRESFVRNIGMDGSGVHCNDTNLFYVDLATENVKNFGTVIEENKEATKQLVSYFRGIRSYSISGALNKIKNKLKMVF